MELTWISDREAVTRIKNCVALRKVRALVKKAGLDLDPKFMCEIEPKISKQIAKEFGVDLTWKLEENGCTVTAKLK